MGAKDQDNSGNFRFLSIGKSRNLWRPEKTLDSLSKEHKPLPLRHSSNIFRRTEVFAIDESANKENADGSHRSRAYSAKDIADGIELFRAFIRQERDIETENEAHVIFMILDQQTRSTDSVAGFFEVLREEDPNRARTFRIKLGRRLHKFFPDESIGIMLTQVFSQEWKNAEKESLLASKEVTNEMKINQLLDFNKRFSRWHSFFISLKRKLMSSVGRSCLHELCKKKEGFTGQALLYLLGGDEEADQVFKTEASILYSQLLAENQLILEILRGQSKKGRERVFLFFKSLIFGFELFDILVTQTNILKLEGAQARSICPDKKQFIYLHLSRVHQSLQEIELSSITPFLNRLQENFTASNFLSCEYNRRRIHLVFRGNFEEHEVDFIMSGQLDRLMELSCQTEPGQF